MPSKSTPNPRNVYSLVRFAGQRARCRACEILFSPEQPRYCLCPKCYAYSRAVGHVAQARKWQEKAR